jgi:hypothetical protein
MKTLKEELIDFINWLDGEYPYSANHGERLIDEYISINSKHQIESRSVSKNEEKEKVCNNPGTGKPYQYGTGNFEE